MCDPKGDEAMGNQGETTNRMPLSSWDVFNETMRGGKECRYSR